MNKIDVSVIIPVYNAAKWLDECLGSLYSQEFDGTYEVSAYDDASTDESRTILQRWKSEFYLKGINFILTVGMSDTPKGSGFAKNQAIQASQGEYLCFFDADDVMHPARIQKQYQACVGRHDSIVGCQFHREPEGSTPRYTNWANSLNELQLYTQIYTSFGPTVVMPTWFCHRSVFLTIGGFCEDGKGTPEDLLFFYAHLREGKKIHRVDENLLMYRYHPEATTFSISEETVWNIRLAELENNILCRWNHFTIWNAGKQGRKFYRSISDQNKAKVKAFCDVDEKKLQKGVYIYEESKHCPKPRVPIVHFTVAEPPFILCMKIEMTGGNFEENLKSLNLREGIDYFHFN